MNIFILAWNASKQLFPAILDELHQITALYPHLDTQTAWHFTIEDKIFAASIHTSLQSSLPRYYVSQSEDRVVFYSGCVLDKTGSFDAHNAQDIASHWESIPESIEGHFAIIRITKYPPRVELINDFLGIEQVYYIHFQNTWLVSNSVNLLSKISGQKSFDLLGVSLFLIAGWVGSDRTLCQNIRVLPAAQRWTWVYGSLEPRKETYFQRYRLTHQIARSLSEVDVSLLAEKMLGMAQSLFHSFGKLGCPLSGGRDSRVLAALLLRNKIPAEYFTNGEPSSTDVEIATQIAQVFSLCHEVNLKKVNDITQNWESYFLQFIRQYDGMLSLRMINLWHIADVNQQPSIAKRKVLLSGIGGEIARGCYSEISLFKRVSSKEDLIQYLTAKALKYSGKIISSEAVELSKSYLLQFINEAIDEGFSLIDIPDLFYIGERLRRWAGISLRKSMLYNDHFSLFCTIPFVEAAFSITPLSRYREILHYELIEKLMPQLNCIPFDTPWPEELCSVKNIKQNVFNRADYQQISAFDKSTWLENNRHRLLELCLEQSSSSLWDYINRSRFEHLMSDAYTPEKRRKYVKMFFAIFTLFYYDLGDSNDSLF